MRKFAALALPLIGVLAFELLAFGWASLSSGQTARDLHDSVTQSLFGLHLMARGLKASAPDSFKGQLAELESLASDILREMRLLLDQLRNASAEETVDLTEAIQSQCETSAHKTGPEGGPLLIVETEMPSGLILPSSVAEALALMREHTPDVALMDLQMPKVDGVRAETNPSRVPPPAHSDPDLIQR